MRKLDLWKSPQEPSRTKTAAHYLPLFYWDVLRRTRFQKFFGFEHEPFKSVKMKVKTRSRWVCPINKYFFCVVLPSLKWLTGTSFSIVCTMCLTTAPAFPTSMFTRPMTCCSTATLWCICTSPAPVCSHWSWKGGSWKLSYAGAWPPYITHNFQLWKLYSLNSLFLRAKQAVLVASLLFGCLAPSSGNTWL